MVIYEDTLPRCFISGPVSPEKTVGVCEEDQRSFLERHFWRLHVTEELIPSYRVASWALLPKRVPLRGFLLDFTCGVNISVAMFAFGVRLNWSMKPPWMTFHHVVAHSSHKSIQT